MSWWHSWKESPHLDSSPHPRLEMEGNTTSPWLQRVWMQHRALQRANPDPGAAFQKVCEGCQAALLPYCSSNACITYLRCWFPSPSFPASPGAVLTTHLEQLLCLQTVSGTAARSWRGPSPPIPASLYRPLGKS